jgi:hypothetical protein
MRPIENEETAFYAFGYLHLGNTLCRCDPKTLTNDSLKRI